MWTGRGGQADHDRAAGSMPTMPPGEPADKPLLQILRRPANERRATRRAPGVQPCPGWSRMALQARPCGQGAAGKALAVGVAVLAAEAGLSWLQRRSGAEERSSLPADRGLGSASRGYLVSQRSLEEVLLQTWEGPHSRV